MSTREERLTALNNAVQEWADSEEKRLTDEADFLRSIFNSRTNGGRLADYVTQEASSLVDDEINAFLIE
jgi:hypothetical protein